MSWRGVLRILGILLMIFSGTVLPPILVSLGYADGQHWHFVHTGLVILVLGIVLWLPLRHADSDLKIRDGFMVVALFWSVLGVLGSLPFLFGLHLSFTDAVFEAVSGFTTTGATVIVGLDQLPPSMLYHRQQLQWLGGMGVIVLAVAILPMLGVGGMQLYRAEVSGVTKDEKLTPRITQTARALWTIYLGLTLVCALAYWIAGMSLFDAIGHAYSTVATGGYSTHDASIGHYNSPWIEGIAMIFMLLGGINFALHFTAWHRRRPSAYAKDPEFRAYLALCAGSVLVIAAVLWVQVTYDSAAQSLRHAAFQVVSVLTSTGFGTATFAEWPLFVPLLLAVLSFIGGCAGSTAGGMKIVRVMLLFKQGGRQTVTLLHPRAVHFVKLGRRRVPEEVMQSVWGFFSLYMLSVVVLTIGMMAAGLDLESAFGAVIATINLLGPGLGEVAGNFATVNDAVKWMGVFAMLLGRLEVFTLLVIFTVAFWRP